ncbi:MAG: prepilin-type N-terminal cleavage/methylation domain-containing protein [Planctomycetes bacterium]|nr:prepilin-type N-terminal cleavage/methylation domain-containing protein [Planctomycetota bacterium]
MIRNRTGPRGPHPGTQSGFSLIEVAISVALLGVGLVALSSVIVQSTALQQTSREEAAAHNTCRDVIERLRNGDLDASLPVFSQLDGLDSESMRRLGSQASVQITYPTAILDSALAGASTETQARLPDILRYQDGDDDGYIDLVPETGKEGRLLPVRVVVRWVGSHGPRAVTRTALVTQK